MDNNDVSKVCNSVNCFYASEYISHDSNIQPSQECRFCAYDFNKLQQTRDFLRQELVNSHKNLKNKIQEKLYECIIKMFVVISGAFILVYFLCYFRVLSRY